MLVLTRRIGECILIGGPGDTIIVTVLQIKGNQVRLGFEASRDIPIVREELAEKKYESSPSVPTKKE
jgi:carbon storage regulator